MYNKINYLKSIKALREYEKNAQKAQMEACKLIDKIASIMYDAELDRQKYMLWQTIKDIAEVINITY